MPDPVDSVGEQPATAVVQPLLAYSDIELPEHVTKVVVSKTRPDVCKIFLPISSGWWPVVRPIAFTFIAMAATLGVALVAHRFTFSHFGAFAAEIAIIVTGSLATGWNGRFGAMPLPRRVAFEITPYAFHMTTAGVFGVSRSKWPRSVMTEVRLNEVKHVLELRISRFDFLAVFVSGDKAVNTTVYNELAIALMEIPAASKEDQLLQPDPADGLAPSPLRTAMHRTGIGLMISAVVAAPFTHGWSLLLIIPSAALVGIAVGARHTQDSRASRA